MAISYNANALFAVLNQQDLNLFNIYPRLLAELLRQEDEARQNGDMREAENLVLPSDKEWRLTQYFKLVGMQKALLNDGDTSEEVPVPRGPSHDVEDWAPWNILLPYKSTKAPPPVRVRTSLGPAWEIEKVLKAGSLLCKPPLEVNFVDEQDMRSVYTLIYEVFRYKSVLDQVIEDIDFFGVHPALTNLKHLTWLFLMELARRRWLSRSQQETEVAARLMAINGSQFIEVEAAVWAERVHFAAAIARMRIKHKAFSLCQLLPPHLREERISNINRSIVTGWVNTFKTNKVATLIGNLQDLGFSYSNSRQLCAGEYRFDRVCPRFMTLRPPDDMSIGEMDLVKDGIIVLQEREFCEGASTLCRALRANSLSGVVAQTHASSPRCSAYLASQLRELAAAMRAQKPAAPVTPELGRLVVFGAGDRVESYVCALRQLGIPASEVIQSDAAVCVLREAVHCESANVTIALTGVVAALATPPNSYSAVLDPIDLVCGRGGDLAMLEILTESVIDSEGQTRVQTILEEQKKTLKTLMSKPQIQLILYETHSSLEAENAMQVKRAVAEANRLARERHLLINNKHNIEVQIKDVDTNRATSMSTLYQTLSQSDMDSDDYAMNMTQCSTTIKASAAKDDLLKRQPDGVVEERPHTTKARPIPALPVENPPPHDPDEDYPNIYVPGCDLFEVHELPNLGNGLDIDYILDRDGCYLGLIQRQEITRMDAKYMIQVAEERGLFTQAPNVQRRKRPDAEKPRPKRRKAAFEVERVAAPTFASLSRSHRRGNSAPVRVFDDDDEGVANVCTRHQRRQAAAAAQSAFACSCYARHKYSRSHN